MSENSVLCNFQIKACFDQQENPSKMIQMVTGMCIPETTKNGAAKNFFGLILS